MKRVKAPRDPARSAAAQSQRPRIALALAGGGPLGAIYEIGALCALQDCLPDLNFNRFEHYIGVSAGGFIAAGLANDLTPRQMCDIFIEDQQHDRPGPNSGPAWRARLPCWPAPCGPGAHRAARSPAHWSAWAQRCPRACWTTRASTTTLRGCLPGWGAATTFASCARA